MNSTTATCAARGSQETPDTGGYEKATTGRINRPKLSEAEKQKAKLKKAAERRKESKKEQRQKRAEQAEPHEYFVMEEDSDDIFDAVFARFQGMHASSQPTLDMSKIPRKKLVAQMDAQHCDDEQSKEKWKASATLPCPVCKQGLRCMLRHQGRGGWHSILQHMVTCKRTASAETVCSALSLEAALCVAWEEATAVSDAAAEKRTQVHTAQSRSKKSNAECEVLSCRICQRTFRGSDRKSFEQHQKSCQEKQLKRKHMHEEAVEFTGMKVEEARQRTQDAEAKLADARKAVRKVRQQGEQRAKEQKVQQRQAKKSRNPYAAEVLSTAEVKAASCKALEKAQRTVDSAQKHVEGAKQYEDQRKEVASRVQEQAKMEDAIRNNTPVTQDKSIKPRPLYGAKPQAGKKGKKDSKETKATKAKEKTVAKKGRRGGPQQEGVFHESCTAGYTSSRRGKANMAMEDD